MIRFANFFSDDRPARPQVIMVHDALGSPSDWTGLTEFFATTVKARRVAAEDLADQFRSENQQPVHVIAHGTGVAEALRQAALAPWKIKSLTFIDPEIVQALPGLFLDKLEQHRLMRAMSKAVRAGDAWNGAQTYVDFRHGPETWAKSAVKFRLRTAQRFSQLQTALSDQVDRPLGDDDLAGVVCPVLLLTGAQAGPRIRDGQKTLALKLPFTRSLEIADASGSAHLCAPHLTHPAIQQFLKSIDGLWQTNGVAAAQVA